jgi:transposase
VLPKASAETTGLHLAEIGRNVAPGAHALLVLDGAGWHRSGKKLTVPDNITLLPLPPYSPELNPVENVWEFLRGNYLCHLVWDSYEQIVGACCDAWNKFVREPGRIASIATRPWASVIP